MQEKRLQQKGKEDDSDRRLAQNIMNNKQYGITTSTQADDEYDFDRAPSKKSKKKGAGHQKRSHDRPHVAKRIVTQQERCVFCFENSNRPEHLVVAIGNFTYLMLPQFEPVTPGHCCIVTLQAIDEAEDEWSQHNAKKLIDTSQKGLRSSIPKNFPYFHVEFGLSQGFVHVIDDETQWKTSFGLNVVRGMLKTQDENMYRRRRYDSIEVQKEAAGAFAKDWEPLDWTKQLD